MAGTGSGGGDADKPLRRGARGAQVHVLWMALTAVGVDVGTDDGMFGPRVLAGVKLFQQRAGLDADGIVGPDTWKALNAAGAGEEAGGVPGRDAGAPWMKRAKQLIGLKEIPGDEDNPAIVQLWKEGKISWAATDEDVPWCAVAHSAIYESVGIRSTRSAWARSYESWGQETPIPAFGATAVFWRGDGPDDGGRKYPRGHVGHIVAARFKGTLLVALDLAGGNQGNAFKIATYPTDQLLTMRWPLGRPLPTEAAPMSISAVSDTIWV